MQIGIDKIIFTAMKKSLPLIILLTISTSAFSQGLKDRYFSSIGSTYFLDVFTTPVKSETFFDEYSQEYETEYSRSLGFSYFTFMYRARLNVMQLSEDMAISASLTPALGISVSDAGIGSFNMPLLISAELGAGSTYSSASNLGFSIGAGAEYTNAGLINSDLGDSYIGYTKSWVQPVVATGIRYWNKRNKLREINIKYGFGDKKPYQEYQGDEVVDKRSMTVRLSFMYMLNY